MIAITKLDDMTLQLSCLHQLVTNPLTADILATNVL